LGPQRVERVSLRLAGYPQLSLLLAERTGRGLHLLVDVLVVRIDAIDQVRASRGVERVVAFDERRQLCPGRRVREQRALPCRGSSALRAQLEPFDSFLGARDFVVE
jgi:hypothetical protein